MYGGNRADELTKRNAFFVLLPKIRETQETSTSRACSDSGLGEQGKGTETKAQGPSRYDGRDGIRRHEAAGETTTLLVRLAFQFVIYTGSAQVLDRTRNHRIKICDYLQSFSAFSSQGQDC
jgi:hypothetical protein